MISINYEELLTTKLLNIYIIILVDADLTIMRFEGFVKYKSTININIIVFVFSTVRSVPIDKLKLSAVP